MCILLGVGKTFLIRLAVWEWPYASTTVGREEKFAKNAREGLIYQENATNV